MKFLTLLVIVFSCVTLVPGQSQALVGPHKFQKWYPSSLGPTIKKTVGNGTRLTTFTNIAASGAFTSSAGRLGANLIARTPWGAAGTLALGYLYYSDIDMQKAFNGGALWQFPAISDFLNDYYGVSSEPKTGDIVDDSFAGCLPDNYKITSIVKGSGEGPVPQDTCTLSQVTKYYEVPPEANGQPRYGFTRYYISPVAEPATFPHLTPTSITASEAAALGQAIAAALSPALQSALESLLQAHPDLVEQPDAITNSDVQNWAMENNYTSNQEYVDYLTNQYNNYEGDTAMQQYYQDLIEQAQEDQADEEKDEAEDTFSPIADNPFADPYAPGEFDIPARFTAFLNNVKSSGLFSFSSSFFNSLPGGGSPVYEIEAGQYGTHRIDLSQTLSTGLAVLKTVVMLCFGFLSIRAVILKR